MSDVLVQAQGLSKSYPIVSRHNARLRALGNLLFGRAAPAGHCVLKPMDLVVRRGESTAIIGENGAGKSTLLKLITKVLTPTTGSVQTHGSVGALLELGAGFHPEYTGRENLRMAGALAGLSAADLRAREAGIIAFADIGDYIDEPIKHYSSGMIVRLGFAIVAALKPDLLITDEVLAVGDESFQKKCISWMENYLAKGGTLLLVSHGMYHVQKLCRRAIWLRGGEVAAAGDAFEVSQAYLAYHERKQRTEQHDVPTRENAQHEYRVAGWRIDGENDIRSLILGSARPLDIEVDLEAHDDLPPTLLAGVAHGNGLPIYGISSEIARANPVRIGAGRYRHRLRLDLSSLLPGEYLLKLHPMDAQGLRLFGTEEIVLIVRGQTRELGVVRLPNDWNADATVASPVEIIIPVYNAVDSLRRCLDALVDRLPEHASVQIVDDASPDPAVTTLLQQHAITQLARVRLERNERNLGFVASVNRAMARTPHDVVLLNSDAIVTHGWLDRLLVCARSNDRIASITPFSNNAEICSLPVFCRNNPVPADPELLARAAATAGSPDYPELPTGVGFCMFVRRAAWQDVGEFDAETFGRGYGEENDWCRRAAARGWRNVLCDDAYVVHIGGTSFADTGHQPGGEQLARLLNLHPDYNELVADFIRRDPVAERRAAVLARFDALQQSR